MLKFIYLVLGMIATPFIMEFVNTQTQKSGVVTNAIKGWPAYAVSVIVAVVVAVIITVLPGGWSFSLGSLGILVLAIYFGNQFFFNTLIKPVMKHRNGTENR